MAQVIVVEDENGNIVRETMKDTDTLARYKTMHETLVYLSHLDHEDTEEQMLTKLQLQVSSAQRPPTFPSHLHRLVHCSHNTVQSRAITKETHIQIFGYCSAERATRDGRPCMLCDSPACEATSRLSGEMTLPDSARRFCSSLARSGAGLA